jgi:GTP-binding protein Era
VTPATRFGHIAIAGAPNVGKSSLLNAIVGHPLAIVSSKAQATRAPTVGLRTRGDTQFVFHDLPGLLAPGYLMHRRMMASALEVLRGSDVVLQLHPAPEGPAPALAQLMPDPEMTAAVERLPVVVAMTKCDVVTAEVLAGFDPAVVAVSATTGLGIEQLLDRLESSLPVGPWQYPEDDLGTQPVRFFVGEYLREAAFSLLEEEVPYSFSAEVEEFREDRDPVYIRATLYIERDSQKRILIGAGGRTIKALGQHARQRLEELIGRRVYLETWVKVLPKWRESAAVLSRIGLSTRASGEQP